MSAWWPGLMHGEELELHRVSTGPPGPNGRAATTEEIVRLTGYGVQPAGATDSLGDERIITTRYRVSGPVTDQVREHDAVVWRGRRFAVEGEPQTYVGGALNHTEFFIRSDRG